MQSTSTQHINRARNRYVISILVVGAVIVFLGTTALVMAQHATPSEIDRRADELLSKLTLQQKIELLGGEDNMFTRAIPEIGLPRLKMSDGPMGVRTWGETTGYAAGIGLAASWDVDLAKRVGSSIGQDARARGVNFLLGPGINIYRLPLNGRNFEYFGEDPYLAGQIAAHYIMGVQNEGVVATVKHFAMNNSEYDRHNVNSVVDERTMREIYLPAFEAAVKEGHVGAVMDSYNLINGVHATQNDFLNNEVLKKEWGFRGILMSDWGATYDGVADANAGLDLEMPFPRFMNPQTLLPAIQDGKVSQATIDDKVRRILRVALEFGFLDRDQTDLDIPLYSQASRATALQSAEESAVLLKNEGAILPLDLSQIHSIAVIGPNAYPAVPSAGGSAEITSFDPSSFMTGISDLAGDKAKVYWSPGIKDLREIFTEGGYSASSFTSDKAGKHPGLKQEEFDSGTFEGNPDRTSTAMHINSAFGFQFGPASRTHLAVRWTGYYTPKTNGAQRFIAAAIGGDSYKLYVNDKLVLESKAQETQSPLSADVDLTQGTPASVRFEYVSETNRIRASLGVIPADEMLQPDVKKIASMADAVVVCIGFNPESEGEGRDRTYTLPIGQDSLIKAIASVNRRTIVVLTAGGSVDTSQWIDSVPVFIQDWYGGSEAGHALAALLLGKADPSGRLPISWERHLEDDPAYKNYYEEPGTRDVKYAEGIFIGYRYFDKSETKPLFPFGFGLSYTTFAFSHLAVTPEEASADGPITVSFDVMNTGDREGAEVAEVYEGDPSATVPRPIKELKGFERVTLNPGETKHVSVTLDRRSLAYWDVAGKDWKVDPGKFGVYVGDSSAHVPLTTEFTVQKRGRQVRAILRACRVVENH